MSIDLAQAFTDDLRNREGQAGRAWMAALPARIDELLEAWELRRDGDLRHGYVAVVLPVRRADGTGAALKVTWPGPDQAPEAPSLAAWDGAGAVRLLRHDERRWALLLERLDPRRDLTGVPVREATAIIGGLLARLHRARAPAGIPSLAVTAARWAEEMPQTWTGGARELPRRWLDQAVANCQELGPGSGSVLLHVDLHYENVLAGDREPLLAIDPKGLAGDPEFESLAPLWNRVEEYGEGRDGVRDRLALLCETAGLEPERARRWAVARIVEDAVDRQADAVAAEREIDVHLRLLAALAD